MERQLWQRFGLDLQRPGRRPAGAVESVARRSVAEVHDNQTLPAPKPIPGGIDLSAFGLVPPYDFIHTFAPGPVGIVLPFTGVALQGLNVEPSTITDFRGDTAVAYHIGQARGSDGNTYNLETDIRVMDGRYVAVDGTTRHCSFALI